MDGLVVIWGIASIAFGITLVVLWLDTGPTRDACDELERRIRELNAEKETDAAEDKVAEGRDEDEVF